MISAGMLPRTPLGIKCSVDSECDFPTSHDDPPLPHLAQQKDILLHQPKGTIQAIIHLVSLYHMLAWDLNMVLLITVHPFHYKIWWYGSPPLFIIKVLGLGDPCFLATQSKCLISCRLFPMSLTWLGMNHTSFSISRKLI